MKDDIEKYRNAVEKSFILLFITVIWVLLLIMVWCIEMHGCG